MKKKRLDLKVSTIPDSELFILKFTSYNEPDLEVKIDKENMRNLIEKLDNAI